MVVSNGLDDALKVCKFFVAREEEVKDVEYRGKKYRKKGKSAYELPKKADL